MKRRVTFSWLVQEARAKRFHVVEHESDPGVRRSVDAVVLGTRGLGLPVDTVEGYRILEADDGAWSTGGDTP